MTKYLIFFKRVTCSLFLVMILNSCSSPSEKPAPKPDTETEEPTPTIYTVEMTQMRFFPAELKVKKGDKVVFVNHDILTHDVTEEAKKAWSSSPLTNGQSWALVVTESVNYFCSIHPVMKGRIIVE